MTKEINDLDYRQSWSEIVVFFFELVEFQGIQEGLAFLRSIAYLISYQNFNASALGNRVFSETGL